MGGRRLQAFVALGGSIATVAGAVVFGVWALSGVSSERQVHAWILLTACVIVAYLSGCGLAGWRGRCFGDPGQNADDESVALAEDVIRSGEWCRIPEITDLGGAAIALTVVRQLTWRVERMKKEMAWYLEEWAKEGVLDVGTPSVTVMFHVMACRHLIHMQLESDSHFEGLVEKHSELKRFRDEIQSIIDEFYRNVVGPLLRARAQAEATEAQTEAEKQVLRLLQRARELDREIGVWKDLVCGESDSLRAKLLGRVATEGAAT